MPKMHTEIRPNKNRRSWRWQFFVDGTVVASGTSDFFDSAQSMANRVRQQWEERQLQQESRNENRTA